MLGNKQIRCYNVNDCIAFRKTSDQYCGLSNMEPKYSISINNTKILTSEALYQSCRFPHNPEIQKLIIGQRSPMLAKEISRQHMKLTRSDWDDERVNIMRWVLRAKLVCNWKTFGELLDSTGEKNIVEDSNRDTFWGAIRTNDTFWGVNALGRLLMQLRAQYRYLNGHTSITLSPPEINNFFFLGLAMPLISVDTTIPLDVENIWLW